MTRFSSVEVALDFVADFAHISPRTEEKFVEVELTLEIRKKVRHKLQNPVCYKFKADDKEHTIVVDIHGDSFVCWYVNGKGFGREL